jgi:YHS domain-containing protein
VEEDQYRDENILYDCLCVVCGKAVKIEESSVHLKVGGEMISICCPLCYEAYQKRPSSFLALRALRAAQRRATKRGDAEVDG